MLQVWSVLTKNLLSSSSPLGSLNYKHLLLSCRTCSVRACKWPWHRRWLCLGVYKSLALSPVSFPVRPATPLLLFSSEAFAMRSHISVITTIIWPLQWNGPGQAVLIPCSLCGIISLPIIQMKLLSASHQATAGSSKYQHNEQMPLLMVQQKDTCSNYETDTCLLAVTMLSLL